MIVVVAGLLTIFALNAVLAHALRTQLLTKGQALTHTVGESIANALIDGDLLAVQDALANLKATSPDVVYAYAFGPDGGPVIHTFTGGFPTDLLAALRIPPGQDESVRLLATESGPVRDFAWRPLDGLPAEVHIGFTENQILAAQEQVTLILAGLTFGGVLFGIVAAVAFSRLVARPLTELARYARRLGQGKFDELPMAHKGDEIGELASAFAQMAGDVKESMDRLRVSETGYRALIGAASEVGESIALIAHSGPKDGTFLFVNDEFCRLTGYSRERLLGANAAEILHPDGLAQVTADWQAIQRGEPSPRHEMVLVTRNGRTTSVETGGTLVNYQGQEALAWFARDIAERKAREQEIQKLWTELQDKERLRAELLARAIHVQEDERRRIARELHDETGQALNAMVFGLKAAEAALASDPGRAQEVIAKLKAAASDNVRELQSIIYDLRPSVLDDLGLIPALRWFVETRLEAAGLEVRWEIRGAERRLKPEAETALFRVAQEALSNVLRHSAASRVDLGLDFGDSSVTLSVSDNGQGFEVEPMLARRDESGRGLGLLGMRERVELLGGVFSVESTPGEGTTARAEIPCTGNEAGA
jgi:PAS domain S-box-containing protein